MNQPIVFYIMSGLLLFFAAMVVTRKNPVASAIYLIGSLFLVAGLFAYIGADFLAAIQVLVYAGAIMVLFLFVIMLLNIDPGLLRISRPHVADILVMIITIVSFTVIGIQLLHGDSGAAKGPFTPEVIASEGGNTKVVGLVLFAKYLWPFELASLLILLAIVASVVIAKKDPQEHGAHQ